jgi:hypothetical protein
MAVSLVVNGTSFAYPQTGDQNWSGTNGADAWAAAVTVGMLQKGGGLFTLLSDVNFGANFGVVSKYFTSMSATSAVSGAVRLANTDAINWRNAANTADVGLSVNASNALLFNGAAVQTGLTVSDTSTIHQVFASSNLSSNIIANSITDSLISTSAAIQYSKLALAGAVLNTDLAGSIAYSKLLLTGAVLNADLAGAIAYSKLTLTGSIVNADISAAAAIAVSKLAALTVSRAVATDGSGVLTPSATTATELGYLSGVTSAVQTQLNAKTSNPMTTAGDIVVGGAAGAPTRLALGGNNTVLTSNGATATWAAAGTASPLTTKGDLYGFSTVNARIPVGADNKVAVADSTSTLGVSYQYPTAKNYISNPSFESNTTTNWSLGVLNGLAGSIPNGTPTFGSGASGSLSIAAVSSGALSGSYSLALASSAATTTGDMLASAAFTIDASDQAKVLTFKFYYSPTVGTATANWSGTSINSFGVAIRDITNSAWIIPAGAFGMTQSSGVGLCTGTFQTPSNGSQFRLVVYNANSTSGAITLLLDDVSVSPQTIPIGAAITDWAAYTPVITGFGTPSAVDAEFRQVGDSYEIKGKFTAGTSTGVEGRFSLPNSAVSKDTSIIPSLQVCGVGAITPAGAYSITTLMEPSVGYVTFGRSDGSTAGLAKKNANTLINAAETMSFSALVPIQGKSSNVQVSSDTDTRVIAAKAVATGTVSLTSGSALILPAISYDTSGSYNVSTGAYVCPVSGFYKIGFASVLASTAMNFSVYVNGTKVNRFFGHGGASAPLGSGSYALKASAGDSITIVPDTTATLTYSVGDVVPTLTIERVSGPSVIAASESVNAVYGLTTAQAVTAPNPIKYDTKIKDTHAAYSATTGLYTAPISGTYSFGGAFTSSAILGVYFNVNGVTQSYLINAIAAGTVCNVATSWPLNAGDTVALYVDTSGTFSANAGASGYRNMFYITRTGN